jgi:hypothetical protein
MIVQHVSPSNSPGRHTQSPVGFNREQQQQQPPSPHQQQQQHRQSPVMSMNNANNNRSFSPTAMAAQIPVPPPINTQRPPSIHQPQQQTDINQLLPPLPRHHHPTVRSPVYQPFPGSVRPEQDFEKRQQQQQQQFQQQQQSQQFHSPPFSGGAQMSPASPNHRSPTGGYYHQQQQQPQQQQQYHHHQQQQSSFYAAADNGIADINRSASSDNSSGFTSIENLRVNLSTTSSISHSSMSSSPQYQRNLPGIMNNNYHHNVERSSFSENSSEISLEDHLASLSDGIMNMNTGNNSNNSVGGSYNYPTNPAARMKASPTNSVRSSSLSSIGSLSTGGLSMNTNLTNPQISSSNAAPLGIAGHARDSSYSGNNNNSMFHDQMFWNK